MSAPLLYDISTGLLLALEFAAPATALASLIVTPAGLVPGAAALGVSATISATQDILLAISGGSDGERYTLAVRASDASGGVTERIVIVAAVNPLWTMADGSAGWLSIIEFVEKFGLDECVRATDPDRSGVIDRRYLIGALRDAQAEVQLNLAARYSLPLSVVPDIVKSAIADLTAVRLYHRVVPDSVSDAAKAQRATLKRIADGAVMLPGVAGVAVEAAVTSEDPILFHSGGSDLGGFEAY